jgi:hypothetical protein
MPQLILTIPSGVDDAEIGNSYVSNNAVANGRIGIGLGAVNSQSLRFDVSSLIGMALASIVLRVTPANGHASPGIATKVRAEAADDAGPLPNGTTLPTFLAIPRTVAAVDFDIGDGQFTFDVPIDSPDIKGVVEEVLARPGFGGHCHILWDDDGSTTPFGAPLIRHFDGDPAKAPKLIVAIEEPTQSPDGGHLRRIGHVGRLQRVGHVGSLRR